VAIDPSNTDMIYVWTSGNDGSAEPDMVQKPPTGLYKSTDRGSSWVLLGSGYPARNTENAIKFAGQNINVVIVDRETTPGNIGQLRLLHAVFPFFEPAQLAESEVEGFSSGIEKLDLKPAIGDLSFLPDELVEPLFDNDAVALIVDVRAMCAVAAELLLRLAGIRPRRIDDVECALWHQ
jgi:hypothetical protein